MVYYRIDNSAYPDVRQLPSMDLHGAPNERASFYAPRHAGSRWNSVPVPSDRPGQQRAQSLVDRVAAFLAQVASGPSQPKAKVFPDVPPQPQVNPQAVRRAAQADSAPVLTCVPAQAHGGDIPGLSDKRNGAKPLNIWSGFRQGPGGNCATVATIKAAMHTFGQSPTDIYREVRRLDGGYRVTMRDNYTLTLTDRELAVASRASQFIGPDKGMLKDAHFLFAVSAKRAHEENNDTTAGESFDAGVESLNDGEDEEKPGEGFLRLGLIHYMKNVSVRELAEGHVGVSNRRGHSVAVINGLEEIWGRPGAEPRRGEAVALKRTPCCQGLASLGANDQVIKDKR